MKLGADLSSARLAPYADTEDGKLFAQKLWTETADKCSKIDVKASQGLVK